jgi:dihydrofolate reductase
MRKVIVTNIVSADGFYEGPGGNVMALPMDHAFDAYNAERLRSADTLLLGRRSFELFLGFWPSVADDPAASVDQREISRRDTAIQKLVVSDTLTGADTGAWRDTTTIVPLGDAPAAVAELRDGEGGDVLVFASRTLWHALLAAGLVDELHLVVGGALLGGGTPAFPPDAAAGLSLLGTRRFDGSDNVVLQYTVRRD